MCALQASECGGHGGREQGSAIVGDEEEVRYSCQPETPIV